MPEFLMGATAMGCWVAMLFFLRFWRDSGDPLFGMFSASFLLLGLARLGLVMMHEPGQSESYFYWVRLVAYLLILIAIVNKNRK